MKTVFWGLIAVCMVCMGWGSSVTAQVPTYDWKSLPATSCAFDSNHYSPSMATSPSPIMTTAWNGITINGAWSTANPSAGGLLWVSCPIVRDDIFNNGSPLVKFVVVDQSTTKEAECGITTTSYDTSFTLETTPPQKSGVVFVGVKTLQAGLSAAAFNTGANVRAWCKLQDGILLSSIVYGEDAARTTSN